MNIIEATKHLKVAPHAVLHFLSRTHTADKHGIIRNVPHDAAVILITNGDATEATKADITSPPADDAPMEAAKAPLEPVKAAEPAPAVVVPDAPKGPAGVVPEANAE